MPLFLMILNVYETCQLQLPDFLKESVIAFSPFPIDTMEKG